MPTHMIMTNDSYDGFQFTGPFDSYDAALRFSGLLDDSIIVEMVDPQERVRERFEAFDCLDCDTNTSGVVGNAEYYMVHDSLWLEANPEDDGMLCLGCLEGRLGRELTSSDFTSAPLNTQGAWRRSERLLDRLTRPACCGTVSAPARCVALAA